MISLKKNNKGFTIVELLIVIVVIGILALLVITTYSGIQTKARNSKRQNDVRSVQTQLEAYFSEQGHYPSLTQMQDSDWVKTNMKSLDQTALHDPSASGNAITLSRTAAAKVYGYDPVTTDGGTTACANDGNDCAAYTLTATFEGQVNGSSTFVKKNLD